MYPEEVHLCGLPLPLELMRPIRVRLAYTLLKEKLRFPERQEGGLSHSYNLTLVNTCIKKIYMSWYVAYDGVVSYRLKHHDFSDTIDYTYSTRTYLAMRGDEITYANWIEEDECDCRKVGFKKSIEEFTVFTW